MCFLGLAKVDTPTKLQEIRHFGGGADDWLRHYSDEQLTQEIERLKALSVRLQSACQECGLVYFEVADDMSSTATRTIRYLSKGNAS